MNRLLTRASHARDDDSGMGMILVIGTALVVTMLMIVSVTMASRALSSSTKHVSFEGAVATAETGVDELLARAQRAYNLDGTDDYTYPSTGDTCGTNAGIKWTDTAPSGAAAPGSAATDAGALALEQAWARSWLTTLAASCVVHSVKGDYVFFKPLGHQALYSMGWSPSYGASGAKMRYVKAEYLFSPYAPTDAVLTSGNLDISSSTTIDAAPPNDPSVAAVHTNGDFTNNQGNPTVTGPVSESGTGALTSGNYLGGNVTRTVTQTIPFISAREVWGSQSHNQKGSLQATWYDLCTDGTVHTIDVNTITPCTGPVAAGGDQATVASQGFRGWTYGGTTNGVSTWNAGSGLKANGYSGIYYIDHGNAVDNASNAGSPVPNLTVLASSTSLDCGSKKGGNITWSHTDASAPALTGTFLFADQDLIITANVSLGSDVNNTPVAGFFIAGDQIDLETSSNAIYGAVVAGDNCNIAGSPVSANEIKNPSIHYDPNASTPFVDIINTTLWLEFAG